MMTSLLSFPTFVSPFYHAGGKFLAAGSSREVGGERGRGRKRMERPFHKKFAWRRILPLPSFRRKIAAPPPPPRTPLSPSSPLSLSLPHMLSSLSLSLSSASFPAFHIRIYDLGLMFAEGGGGDHGAKEGEGRGGGGGRNGGRK